MSFHRPYAKVHLYDDLLYNRRFVRDDFLIGLVERREEMGAVGVMLFN